MMRRILLLLIVLLMLTPVYAQYDERQILMQQANQHLVRREYSRAESVYLEILEKYPSDINSILQLMQVYLNLAEGDKAEALLRKYQRGIPENIYTEQRIQLLIMQGEMEKATALAENYLRLNAQSQAKYRLLASYFNRRGHYDQTILIYQKGREELGEAEFALEIANAAMRLNRYAEALGEYLNHMAGSSNMNLFIRNQINAIVEQDSSLIQVIRDEAALHQTNVMRELHASALMTLGYTAEALEVYKELPLSQMRDFAKEQIKQGNYELARAAYSHLAEHSPQPVMRITYGLELAKVFYQEGQYDSSSAVLRRLLGDPYWQQSPANMRSRLHVSIRKLKADNELACGEELSQVRATIQEAKQFSNIAEDIQSLDLDLARLAIFSKDFAGAEKALSRVRIGQLAQQRDYLHFMSQFMQNQSSIADSLMNEYVIRYPGGEYTNDIIYLNMLSINMNDPQRATFSESIRLLQLYKSAGIDSLEILFEEIEDEELLILAIEWAIGLGQTQRAAELLNHDFSDELASEYAQYLRLTLMTSPQDAQALARDFLKTKPNSIFSPRFRQVISRRADSQISI